MTDYCAIQGQLMDVRNVGMHKCVKLTIHVPAEYARKVIDAFGWATAIDPVPVAIARLNGADTSSTTSTGGEKKPDAPAEPRRNTPVARPDSMPAPLVAPAARVPNPLAKKAGRMCADPLFWKFCDKRGFWVTNKDEAADHVRGICEVKSRKDILPGTVAEQKFNMILSAFMAWKEAPRVGL